jgi:predicted Holliday junction resolvase-like endonuclease|tara:strand:+ start:2210 stop:2470 length:261 start_codon:yes stop_codon:yes gene_type:complete
MEYFIVFVLVAIILVIWYCVTTEIKYHALKALQQKDYEFNLKMWEGQRELNEEMEKEMQELNEEMEKEMQQIKDARVKNQVAINDT